MKIKYKDKTQWLQLRKTGIGGSDAPAVLNVSPFSNPIKVWLEKTGQLPEPEQEQLPERLWIGSTLEEAVAKMFEKKANKKVRRINTIIRDDKYPFMIANIDRDVVGEDAILEIKTTSNYRIKEVEQEPYKHWVVQCQHYLAIMQAEKAYLAILAGNEKLIIHEIKKDNDFINMLIKEEQEFWHYVETKEMPAVDIETLDLAVIKALYPEEEASKIIELPLIYKFKIEKLEELKQKIKELETEKANIEKEIIFEIKDAESALVAGTNYIVDYKTQTRKSYVVPENKFRVLKIKKIKEKENDNI